MRPGLLLAGDLAGGDLVEQLLGAVGAGERGDGEAGGVDPVEQLLGVRHEVVRGRGALLGGERDVGDAAVGRRRGLPQVLLDEVPAGPRLALLQVGLAQVEQRVEVAERLGDRLDALPVHPGAGVQRARRRVVACGVRGGERLGPGDEAADLVLDVGDVGRLGRGELGGDVTGRPDGGAGVGHGERRPDAVADHAGLARGEVAARGDLRHQVAGQARADVLHLGDDAQPVGGQQVELGGLRPVVGHGEGERAGRCAGGRQGARVRGGAHGERAATGRAGRRGRGVGHAGGQCEGQDGHGGRDEAEPGHGSPREGAAGGRWGCQAAVATATFAGRAGVRPQASRMNSVMTGTT